MEGDEAVEIELTPVDSRPSHRSPVTATPTADDESGTPGRRRPHLESRAFEPRMVVAMVGIGLVALVAGWFLGRATGSGGSSGAPATTQPTTEETPPATGDTVPAAESLPTTTERRRPSTTTLAPIEAAVIDVDQRLADAAYDLVGVDRDGDLVQLSLSEGHLMTHRDDHSSGMGGPVTIWAGEGWLVVSTWDTGSAVLIDGDEDPFQIPLGPPWQIFAAASGEFWTLDHNLQSGEPGHAQRVDRFGEPVADPVGLSVIPLYGDPAGGLVVQRSGKTYRVDETGVTKIVDGTVLALDVEHAVARTCDDQLECAYVLVDRATGESTPLPIDGGFAASSPYWSSLDATRIAPDGHTIGVTWVDPALGRALGLIDLLTGERTTLSEANDGLVRWSPDGRFAFYLDAGLPMAHEIATGESFVIAAELPRLNALATQPTSDS